MLIIIKRTKKENLVVQKLPHKIKDYKKMKNALKIDNEKMPAHKSN